jgi:hypothetical protein
MANAALRCEPAASPSDLEVLAAEFARHNPTIAAELGVTVEELAKLAATSTPIDKAVEHGWISAEEERFLQGRATMDDLLALGYSHEESMELLVEQRGRACASST